MPSRGTLYDGTTAQSHQVTVEARDGALHFISGDGWTDEVDAALLEPQGSSGADLRLGHRSVPGWRLVLGEPVDPAIVAILPRDERYGRWIDRFGLLRASIAFAVVAIAVVVIGYAAPAWVAPHIPKSWERNVGDAIVGDFGDLNCGNAQGNAALVALVERLEPGATRPGPDQIRIAALDVGMFNAAALPGGHIVVFRGALEELENAEELAGIVAHEIAHVQQRHVAEAMVRELGIGALIRTFAGDIGANAQQLVGLSYTRSNEAEADKAAIAMLRRADVDPRPTARLFDRLAKDNDDGIPVIEFLESHPGTAGRARHFAASFEPAASYRPALAPLQSKALLSACSGKKAGKTD